MASPNRSLISTSISLATVLSAFALLPATATASPTIPAGDGGSSGAADTTAALIASAAASSTNGAERRRAAQRRGGKVRVAWPQRKGAAAPDSRLARWLARQVGPIAVRPARRGAARRDTRALAAASATAPLAAASAAAPGSAAQEQLLLVRSFDIPAGEPRYAALANYSWTYDNALAVFAFLSVGARAQAEQLLDQLRALQLADGSLDFAYNVQTGVGAGRARSGAMAWVGLAASAYRRQYGNSRYDKLIEGVLDHLLALRTSDGLVKGGSDVAWVSTQHNLLTIGLLRDVVDQIGTGNKKLGEWTGSQLHDIQNSMGNAVLSKTLVQNGAYAYFIAGVGDRAVPTDVQALGALYLQLRGDGRATQVADNLARNGFLIAPRKTPAGAGPYSGFRPYLDAGSPDVVWSEGTFEAALALKRLGVASAATTTAVSQLTGSTDNGTVAPIGADRNVDGTKWGEFHTWPTSAAASWLLVLNASNQLLYAR
ncbi:hypothetical protein VSS74_22555 [Conexibacter stalactiti]|uniref:Uncharacterized protein n=1 Tax=Conexibacter stalactiti TaxID=1940611 RepID=A0ABU4HV01_9ACTN|nr:hypothetical protein [Conexibacter stalactiti]MDW5597145.1 hypothetical protein [Conexibacter stalactiti]MEC5037787.1 hypothetical protein [Conexibacter stalactiti]